MSEGDVDWMAVLNNMGGAGKASGTAAALARMAGAKAGQGQAQGQQANEKPLSPTNLYVAGIPNFLNEVSFRELFGRFGTVLSVKLLTSEKFQTKYGFIKFMYPQEAQMAWDRMQNVDLANNGTKLTVRFAKEGSGGMTSTNLQLTSDRAAATISMQLPTTAHLPTAAPEHSAAASAAAAAGALTGAPVGGGSMTPELAAAALSASQALMAQLGTEAQAGNASAAEPAGSLSSLLRRQNRFSPYGPGSAPGGAPGQAGAKSEAVANVAPLAPPVAPVPPPVVATPSVAHMPPVAPLPPVPPAPLPPAPTAPAPPLPWEKLAVPDAAMPIGAPIAWDSDAVTPQPSQGSGTGGKSSSSAASHEFMEAVSLTVSKVKWFPVVPPLPDGTDPTHLYIAGLPANADDLYLYNIFAPFGPLLSVSCMRDQDGHCRGFGFVKYGLPTDAQLAIATLTENQLPDGNIITVSVKPMKATFRQV